MRAMTSDRSRRGQLRSDARNGDVEAQEGSISKGMGNGWSKTQDFAKSPRQTRSPSPTPSEWEEDSSLVLTWKERIRHFTWPFYCLNMATGGIANVIFECPFRFNGLYTIGVIFLFVNIFFFICNTIAMSLRFYHWPSTFRASLLHPTESLFVPAPVISVAIMLLNITQYGTIPGKTGPWLVTTMTIFYWFYLALSFVASAGVYLIMWSTQTFTLSKMTPVWIFPAYPLLIVGSFAGRLSAVQTGTRGLEVIIGGVVVQGIGFMVSLMIYSAYIYRLMTQKLPAESLRPGMFISVGPSGFTITALITMGEHISRCITPGFMDNGLLAGQVTAILANWAGIWLWGLALWFFFVSCAAHYTCIFHRGRMHFAMTWCSFIFPNTALATATFAVARALDHNYPIAVIGSVMLCALIVVWLALVCLMVRAIVIRHILWPGRQEDRDEGGWKQKSGDPRINESEALCDSPSDEGDARSPAMMMNV